MLSGATGLEPAISGLTGQRDKPASLRPQEWLILATCVIYVNKLTIFA